MRSMAETAACMIEAECRHDLEPLEKAEDMLAVTFKAANNHWMFTDEQDQFKGAIGAVLIRLKSGPEFERVERSLRALGKLSAMLNALQQGVPVDLERMLEEQKADDPATIIPLNKLWGEARRPVNGRGDQNG